MSIVIQPTDTEYVDIEHRGWGTRWSMQFPEVLECSAGPILAWPPTHQEWRRLRTGAWGYTWRPSAAYVQEVAARNLTTPDGRPQYTNFVAGAELQAQIATTGPEVALTLTVTNIGDQPLRDVRSEGGCFQARSEAFRDGAEVARTFIGSSGKMTSLAQLPRTEPIRCRYVTGPLRDTRAFEWFWGQTQTVTGSPIVMGAVSRDGQHAVVLGYEQALEALANADDWHHCLHSGPWFGDLAPGESATRRGWILFGADLHALAGDLARRLAPGLSTGGKTVSK